MDSPRRMRLKRRKQRVQLFIVSTVLAIITGLSVFGAIKILELIAL